MMNPFAVCPYCAHQNRQGELFCQNCGQRLDSASDETLKHDELNKTPKRAITFNPRSEKQFTADSSLVLFIRDVIDPIVVHPGKETSLGRSGTNSQRHVDIDLTAYGALQKGVSRYHAIICRDEQDRLFITDAGSDNGTYLNGKRLPPQQPFPLNNGDEVCLARLIIHVYFEQASVQARN